MTANMIERDGGAADLGHAAYETLIDAIGSETLGEVLLSLAEGRGGADEVFAYGLGADRQPFALASAGRAGSSVDRAALYAERFHHLDPLSSMLNSVRHDRAIAFGRLVTDQIDDRAYRYACYDHPGFGERISFVQAHADHNIVLSFYRSRQRVPIDGHVFDPIARAAFPVLRKHEAMIGADRGLDAITRLERRISASFPKLTTRERAVCARTMVGMTAEAIALQLDLRPSTVFTYRRRAYAKTNACSAGALVTQLLG